jgi:hypothetical protein
VIAVVVLESGPTVQGIIFGLWDRLFDECKVVAKQFLGLRASDVRSSAIDRRHGSLCDHEGSGGSGGALSEGHRSSFLSIGIRLLNLDLEPSAARVPLSPFWAGATHIVKVGPIGVEQAFDQVVNRVGKIGSQAWHLATGGKTSNRLFVHNPAPFLKRPSGVRATHDA